MQGLFVPVYYVLRTGRFTCLYWHPVSSENFDLCEIFDLLLFVSHFASQSKGIRLGDYFFDVCCIN